MARHYSLLFFCLLALLFTGSCVEDIIDTTGDIQGHIYDSGTSAPIAFATVQITPTNKTFTTGEDGFYKFSNLESRSYEVLVEKNNYKLQKKTIFVEIGKDNQLDFQLQPSLPELSVSTNTLDFGYTATTLTINIENTGNALLEWQISENIPWLSCLPANGTTEQGSSSSIIVTAQRNGLEKGNYAQTFVIASNGGSSIVEVNMSVQGSQIKVSPEELDFGATTSSLPLALQNIGSGTVSYSVATSNDWIITNRTSGTLTNSDNIIVSVNRNSVSQGDYAGKVSISFKDGSVEVPVRMHIPQKSSPVVSLQDAYNITYNSATIKGAIVTIGSSKVTQYGICWSTTETPTIEHKFSNLGDSETSKDFTYNISGLEPSTKYYVRAYALNAEGLSYSNQIIVNTKDIPQKPEVETGEAKSVKANEAILSGNILKIGEENGILQHGHVWSKNEMPTIENNPHTNLGATDNSGAFTSTLTGLEPNTTYHVRAYATNNIGTSYGNEIIFTTSYEAVAITTTAATDITHNSATAGGKITSLGGHTITERGVCWDIVATPTTANNRKASDENSNTFSVRIDRLQAKKSYHIRAYARTANGQTFYGNDQTFSTTHEIVLPKTGNVTISDVGVSEATFASSIIDDGEGTVSDCGFCYSKSQSPTTGDNKISCGAGTSSFGKTVTKLNENTTYYVRAYAINEAGTSYSPEVSFTTKEISQPTLSGVTISRLNTTSAEVEAIVTGNGNGTITDAGFCYSAERYPSLQSGTKISCGRESTLKTKINGLQSACTYYIRAYAVNEKGVSYSEEAEFTTTQHEANTYTTVIVETTYGTAEINLAKVMGGSFLMGAQKSSSAKDNYDTQAYSDESPVHNVTLATFHISSTVVTQKLWYVVMGNYPSINSSNGIGDEYPIYNVSYNDCLQFINKLNSITGKTFRLPTEAEWEFAARGGNYSEETKWSGSSSCGAVAWNNQNSGNKLHPVAQKQPNELNIYDMNGNVWEWCSDWYGNYSSFAQTNPTGPTSGSTRIIRGGAYNDTPADCRVSVRSNAQPSSAYNNIGFRLVTR